MKRKVLILVSCFIFVLGNFAFTFAASHYTTYATPANINKSGYVACQGFAVGSTYAYSAKINSDETRAVLYRTNMNTGATEQLMNGDNSTEYATYMGHANDMTVCSLNSKSHLFATTMKEASNNLVKIKIDGNKFYKVGQFTFKYGGKNIKIHSVNILTKTSSTITFLCRNGKTFYTGSISLNANSGTITLTKKFTINVADALVKGQKVDKLASFTGQGIGYSKGNLYVPLWGGNSTVNKPHVSVVLRYKNVSASTTGTIKADPNTSFRVTSNVYPKFEIEGCGIGINGTLWFNTNRLDANGAQADSVHYFKGYTQK